MPRRVVADSNVVTGDRALRAIRKYRRVRILTPRAFLSLIR